MTVKILKPPANVPGFGMTETMKDVVRLAKSANVTLSSDTVSPTTLFRVPANTLVCNAFVEFTTAFNTGTDALSSDMGFTVGDSDDADSLVARIEPSSDTATFLSGALAKNYTAAQDIILTQAGWAGGATGVVRVWLQYKTDSDEQEVG